MKKTKLFSLLFTIYALPAYADYQYEITTILESERATTDQRSILTNRKSKSEETNVIVESTYYFSPIGDVAGPIKEASFLSQASSVSILGGYREAEYKGPTISRSYSNEYHLKANVNFDSGIGVSTTIGKTENRDIRGIGLNYYLTDNSSLAVFYTDYLGKSGYSNLHSVEATFKAVFLLDELRAWATQITLLELNRSETFAGNLAYYFSPKTGAYIDVTFIDSNDFLDTRQKTIGMGLTYALSEKIIFDLKIANNDYDNFAQEGFFNSLGEPSSTILDSSGNTIQLETRLRL